MRNIIYYDSCKQYWYYLLVYFHQKLHYMTEVSQVKSNTHTHTHTPHTNSLCSIFLLSKFKIQNGITAHRKLIILGLYTSK